MANAGGLDEKLSCALVSYVPGPLGSQLDSLRVHLSGELSASAHITLLPPRPLDVPASVAGDQVRATLRQFSPFVVRLGDVQQFASTNVLYLSLTAGHQEVLDLHRVLNHGPLSYREQFEFLPHLTISRPRHRSDPAERDRARQLWSEFTLEPSFVLREVVFLIQSAEGVWSRAWTAPIGGSTRAAPVSIAF